MHTQPSLFAWAPSLHPLFAQWAGPLTLGHPLQVISLLKRQFTSAGLDLYLMPYGVVPTGHEEGIIEVVPNAKSRAQLVSSWRWRWRQLRFGWGHQGSRVT